MYQGKSWDIYRKSNQSCQYLNPTEDRRLFLSFSKKINAGKVLATGASGASKLPKSFPVNIIPISRDAIIDNNDSDDQYDMLVSCVKYTTASEMINFYHDNLKKTIFDLNEAPSKDGQIIGFGANSTMETPAFM